MLAERIEAIARLLPSRSADAHDVLLEIAVEVRALEARKQARLSARTFYNSPNPTLSQPSHDGSYWHSPPHISGPECEEPRELARRRTFAWRDWQTVDSGSYGCRCGCGTG